MTENYTFSNPRTLGAALNHVASRGAVLPLLSIRTASHRFVGIVPEGPPQSCPEAKEEWYSKLWRDSFRSLVMRQVRSTNLSASAKNQYPTELDSASFLLQVGPTGNTWATQSVYKFDTRDGSHDPNTPLNAGAIDSLRQVRQMLLRARGLRVQKTTFRFCDGELANASITLSDSLTEKDLTALTGTEVGVQGIRDPEGYIVGRYLQSTMPLRQASLVINAAFRAPNSSPQGYWPR